MPLCDVAVFNVPPNTPGSAPPIHYGWAKPTWACFVRIVCIGPGGGGGSGRKGAAASIRCGGGGGGGGSYSMAEYIASELEGFLFIQVGVGGAGGAAQATNSTNGNAGSNGTDHSSVYGIDGAISSSSYCDATGGGGGQGGTLTTGTGGIASTVPNLYPGEKGADASTTGASGTSAITTTNRIECMGAASGGGITSADVEGNGAAGTGWNPWSGRTAPSGGAAASVKDGGNGQPAQPLFMDDSPIPGFSGGSGAASKTATAAGKGGDGGTGGGGGGGGAALDTTTPNSGAGGKGGDGVVVIISWG